jgi:hypothetical protein
VAHNKKRREAVKTRARILALAFAFVLAPAYAGMIGVDGTERERVKSMLERPEVAAELEKLGVPAAEAKARVDAMTQEEVAQLAGRVDALAAGGATQRDLLLVIVLLLLLILIL